MKPRRITTEIEYQRLQSRIQEFTAALERQDAALFPPDLDPDWREAFRAGYAGQLAELEEALSSYQHPPKAGAAS